MRRQVAVLRDQWPQDRHELCRADILHLDDLGHDVVGTGALGAEESRVLARARVGQDLGNATGLHCDEAVYLEDGEKCFVKRLRGHRRGRQHRHVGIDPRVDNEITAGDLADGLDDLPDICFAVIRRNRDFLLRHCRQG